jgi:hypothetical protein
MELLRDRGMEEGTARRRGYTKRECNVPRVLCKGGTAKAYFEVIKMLEKRHKRRYTLQEDGNSSHGNRSYNNTPAQLKRDSDLQILVHPAKSPDLNPIKAVWQIMKQQLRGRKWKTVAKFKADIQRVGMDHACTD